MRRRGAKGAPPPCFHVGRRKPKRPHIFTALCRYGTLQFLDGACQMPAVASFVVGEVALQGDRIYRAASHVSRERQAGLHAHRFVELRESKRAGRRWRHRQCHAGRFIQLRGCTKGQVGVAITSYNSGECVCTKTPVTRGFDAAILKNRPRECVLCVLDGRLLSFSKQQCPRPLEGGIH